MSLRFPRKGVQSLLSVIEVTYRVLGLCPGLCKLFKVDDGCESEQNSLCPRTDPHMELAVNVFQKKICSLFLKTSYKMQESWAVIQTTVWNPPIFCCKLYKWIYRAAIWTQLLTCSFHPPTKRMLLCSANRIKPWQRVCVSSGNNS